MYNLNEFTGKIAGILLDCRLTTFQLLGFASEDKKKYTHRHIAKKVLSKSQNKTSPNESQDSVSLRNILR